MEKTWKHGVKIQSGEGRISVSSLAARLFFCSLTCSHKRASIHNHLLEPAPGHQSAVQSIDPRKDRGCPWGGGGICSRDSLANRPFFPAAAKKFWGSRKIL